jgi:hypothetical protein
VEAYFKAVVPEPFRILGLSLRPLSLGRYLLLKRFNCVFVAEEVPQLQPGETLAEIYVGSLILGVFICSFRCDEFMALLESGRFMAEVEAWGNKIFETGRWRKSLPKAIAARANKLKPPKPFNYLEKVGLFKRYLNEGMETPEYFQREDGGQMSGAHWSQSAEVVLRSELNWGTEEIQETPLSKAIADYYKWLENKGIIDLVTDSDRELMKAAEANAMILGGETSNIQQPTSNLESGGPNEP